MTRHPGLKHWRWQRWSALPLAPLGLWFIGEMLVLDVHDYRTIYEWIDSPLKAGGVVGLLVCLSIHSSLGLQTIVEDYVRPPMRGALVQAVRLAGSALLIGAVASVVTL